MKPKHPAAIELGRLGGQAKTPRKAAASRANGQKGGVNWKTVAMGLRASLETLVAAISRATKHNRPLETDSFYRIGEALTDARNTLAAISPTGRPKRTKQEGK